MVTGSSGWNASPGVGLVRDMGGGRKPGKSWQLEAVGSGWVTQAKQHTQDWGLLRTWARRRKTMAIPPLGGSVIHGAGGRRRATSDRGGGWAQGMGAGHDVNEANEATRHAPLVRGTRFETDHRKRQWKRRRVKGKPPRTPTRRPCRCSADSREPSTLQRALRPCPFWVHQRAPAGVEVELQPAAVGLRLTPGLGGP